MTFSPDLIPIESSVKTPDIIIDKGNPPKRLRFPALYLDCDLNTTLNTRLAKVRQQVRNIVPRICMCVSRWLKMRDTCKGIAYVCRDRYEASFDQGSEQ